MPITGRSLRRIDYAAVQIMQIKQLIYRHIGDIRRYCPEHCSDGAIHIR